MRVVGHPGARPQPARAENFRRPVAVTSTPPTLSGAVRPGRHGGLMAVAPSRVACRDGWQSRAMSRESPARKRGQLTYDCLLKTITAHDRSGILTGLGAVQDMS